jgi:hypothetical protein
VLGGGYSPTDSGGTLCARLQRCKLSTLPGVQNLRTSDDVTPLHMTLITRIRTSDQRSWTMFCPEGHNPTKSATSQHSGPARPEESDFRPAGALVAGVSPFCRIPSVPHQCTAGRSGRRQQISALPPLFPTDGRLPQNPRVVCRSARLLPPVRLRRLRLRLVSP